MSSQQPYHQPQQAIYKQVVKAPSNGLAVTSLILGLLGIVVGIWAPIPFVGIVAVCLAFLPAFLAVIFGHIGLAAARSVCVGTGQALTGLILGYFTLAYIIIVTLLWFSAIALNGAANIDS